MCGEQINKETDQRASGGSSPRVRGTVQSRLRAQKAFRFIPACAGNRNDQGRDAGHSPVHPRVCGEQSPTFQCIRLTGGSSPRVRGTGLPDITNSVYARFIPACAGNRPSLVDSLVSNTVHPRVCGEQALQGQITRAITGSSPRVRGTAGVLSCDPARSRFIPACAGNRVSPSLHPCITSVHPRVCGEQAFGPELQVARDGSSPRVRGTAHKLLQPQQHKRFIPACAGNRPTCFELPRPPTVHPRVCGEQIVIVYSVFSTGGSSPRVRGTVEEAVRITRIKRFIPACAGNSWRVWACYATPPVHPRVCGEQ